MSAKLVAVCKGMLERSCGPLGAIRGLANIGVNVLCLCSACQPETRVELDKLGIRVKELAAEEATASGVSAKIRHYSRFRRRAWNIIQTEAPKSLLWVAKIDTAMALGKRLLPRPYVLTLQELHDGYRLYQRAMRLYASHASALVVPEYCRANIIRCWHNLESTPFVLPNRPVPASRQRNLPVSDPTAKRILDAISPQRKILLYQGGLGPDRDLSAIAEAARHLGDDYCFVIMGRPFGDTLSRLRRICPGLIHIPWVRPPAHLEITSHAHIGIVFYNHDSLNSIFCAPNKIWEYGAFGVPMICQDIPGLRYTAVYAGAGLCAATRSAEAIVYAIRAIDAKYRDFSQKASQFYDSVDSKAILSKILAAASADTSEVAMHATYKSLP